MSTIETDTDLTFRVTITRAPGEEWPVLQTNSGWRFDVTEVQVDVWFDDGTLTVRTPGVRRGRRVRQDGSLGADAGPHHGYGGWWVKDPAELAAVTQKADEFRELALDAARDAFVRLAALGAGEPA